MTCGTATGGPFLRSSIYIIDFPAAHGFFREDIARALRGSSSFRFLHPPATGDYSVSWDSNLSLSNKPIVYAKTGDSVMRVGNDTDEGIRRRGCSCTKNDFLPEESFQRWGNYARALKATPARLKDRMLTRSLDATELHEVKARSQHEMKKTLSWWDLMWFTIGAVIGAGIFVLTGLEAKEHAGPAVLLSYVVSGVSAMLSVFCYTEFAVEIPVAGLKPEKAQARGLHIFLHGLV
ncbi:hypothetical protein L1049_000264 [Liquidambar formosana]|uniref:Uncharacterized protein n=1 Tax=Liquidambar formosana TaxID=63359 RepID=A0AAP0NA48_LIQFO